MLQDDQASRLTFRFWLFPYSIVEVIDHLVSDNVPVPHPASASTQGDQRHTSTGACTNGGGRSRGHNTHVLSIFAKLHPNDVSNIRDQASKETQDLLAWMRSMSWRPRSERIAAGKPRHLSLVPHPYAMAGSSRPSKNSNSRVWLDMYRDGIAWRSWDGL